MALGQCHSIKVFTKTQTLQCIFSPMLIEFPVFKRKLLYFLYNNDKIQLLNALLHCQNLILRITVKKVFNL
jgi:hypothetical protein